MRVVAFERGDRVLESAQDRVGGLSPLNEDGGRVSCRAQLGHQVDDREAVCRKVRDVQGRVSCGGHPGQGCHRLLRGIDRGEPLLQPIGGGLQQGRRRIRPRDRQRRTVARILDR